MSTARDIITSSLKSIGVLGKGESLDSEDANEALSRLNELVSLYNIDGASIYNRERLEFNLTADKGEYTLGVGGDVNITLPLDVLAVTVRGGDVDYPLSLISLKGYNSINYKKNSGIPYCYYFESNYPLSKLYIYYLPSSGYSAIIDYKKELNGFSSLDTLFSFPEHYKMMLRSNLAVSLASNYEIDPSPVLVREANESRILIESQNSRNYVKELSVGHFPDRFTNRGTVTRDGNYDW